MLSKIKTAIRNTPLYDGYNGFRYGLEWFYWAAGKLERAPHRLKRRVILKRARDFNLRCFVETGTFFGDMVHAQRKNFDQLVSIELDDYLFERAKKRFRNQPHIRILKGDSGEKIAEILSGMNEPCLFWLDAHYSGGLTARGEVITPVFKESHHILTHPVQNHVVLIDDARLFNGADGYPTFWELQEFVNSFGRDYLAWIDNDTISIARMRKDCMGRL